MPDTDSIINFLKLFVIIVGLGLFTAMVVIVNLFSSWDEEDQELPIYEDGEVDLTFYPEEDNNVIFPH